MSTKKQASLSAFFGGGAGTSDKAKSEPAKKQASITGFFGGAADKAPSKPASEPATSLAEEKGEAGAKRRKPNTVIDDDDVDAPTVAAAAVPAAEAGAPASVTKAAAQEAVSPAATESAVSGPAGAAAAVAAAAAASAASAASAVQAVDAGGWQAVPDPAALFKRAAPGYHPLRDVDWKTSILTLGNATERSAAATAAFFGAGGSAAAAAAGSDAAANGSAGASVPPVGALKVEAAPLPYAALTRVFSEVEKTTKRLEITAALTNFLRSVIVTSPQDLLPCLYLCTNTLAPPYENLELGVGDSLLMKVRPAIEGHDA